MARSNAVSADSTDMSTPKRLHAAAAALVLLGALSGCAGFSKCGFKGCPEDAKMTADVRALIGQHTALQAPNFVHVQTIDHVVYLSGTVDTDVERDLAEQVAYQAPGVTEVVNSITLSNVGR